MWKTPRAIKTWETVTHEESAHARWADLFYDLLFVGVAFRTGHLFEHLLAHGRMEGAVLNAFQVFYVLFSCWFTTLNFYSRFDVADSVHKILKKNGLRAEIDLRNEKIGSKIRDHTLNKVPYMVVLGDREVCDEEITIRTQKGDDLGNMKLESFLERVTEEINN